MNFKEKLKSVIDLLQLGKKFEDKTLSQEEFNSVVAEYQKKYQTTLNDDLAAEQAAKQTAQQAAEFQQMLNTIQSVIKGVDPASKENENSEEEQPQSNATLEGILESLNACRLPGTCKEA